MIRCTMADSCLKGKDVCCCQCEDRENCTAICDNLDNLKNCGFAQMEETDALAVMQKQEAAIIQAIAVLTVQKKKIEDQEKEMRAKLVQAMEQYGVKSFENENVKFTYIAPTTRTQIDSAKLKKDLPDIAAKYSKTSNVSASVKITVK